MKSHGLAWTVLMAAGASAGSAILTSQALGVLPRSDVLAAFSGLLILIAVFSRGLPLGRAAIGWLVG